MKTRPNPLKYNDYEVDTEYDLIDHSEQEVDKILKQSLYI